MKTTILTEGGSGIGLGHITRCLALYQALKDKGVDVNFIVNDRGSLKEALDGVNYQSLNWSRRGELARYLRGSDFAVVDSYIASPRLYNKIASIVRGAVYIDDNNRIDYPRGMVVNGNIYAGELKYTKNSQVRYFLGTKYAMLRKEFWDLPFKVMRKNVKTVMVTFGANGGKTLMRRVLRFLSEKYPSLNKKVIIGEGFKDIKSLSKLKDPGIELIFHPGAAGMRDAMMDSDVAITAGGQTLYELMRVGIPSVSIAVAENQMRNVRCLKSRSLIEYAGWWQGKNILRKVMAGLNKYMAYSARSAYRKRAVKFVSGSGARIVADLIVKDHMKNKGSERRTMSGGRS